MLARHYRKVGDIFKDDIRDVLPKDVGITREESAIVNRTLKFHYRERVDGQSQRILRTTQKNIEQAIGRAQRDHPTASRGQIAGVAAANLERILAGRSHGISIYETQWSAEFAKLVEAAVLLGDETDLELKAAGEKKIKIWDSLGDSRVRVGAFNHLRADGQARLPDKPFNVSGEALLFPGDISLGASQGNIQRCRCSAYYDRVAIAKIRKGRVKREDIGAIAPARAQRFSQNILDGFADGALVEAGNLAEIARLEGKIIEKQLRFERFTKNLEKAQIKGNVEKIAQIEKRLGEIKRRTERLVKMHPSSTFTIQGRKFGIDITDITRLPPFIRQKTFAPPPKLKKTRLPKVTKSAPKKASTKRVVKSPDNLDDVLVMPDPEETKKRLSAALRKAGNRDEDIIAWIDAAERGNRGAQLKLRDSFGIEPPNGRWKFNHFETSLGKSISAARKEMQSLGIDLRSINTQSTQVDTALEQVKEGLKKLNALNDVKPVALAEDAVSGLTSGSFTKTGPLMKRRFEDRIRKTYKELTDEGMVAGNLIQSSHHKIRYQVQRNIRPTANRFQNVTTYGLNDDAGALAHELGHHLEYANDAVSGRINEFLKVRIAQAKTKGQKITKIAGGNNGHGYKDGFFNDYVGRMPEHTGTPELLQGHTEVLSMGIESLFNRSRFKTMIAKDPEHIEMLWAILRGY